MEKPISGHNNSRDANPGQERRSR